MIRDGSSRSGARCARAWRVLAVPLLAALAAGPASADVKLTNDQVPKPSGPLKRYKLSRSDAPTAFVQKVLGNNAPAAKLEPLAQSKFAQKYNLRASVNVQAAVDAERVVAVVDGAKGHADVFPLLEKMTPLAASDGKTIPAIPKSMADQAQRAAQDVLAQGVFPRDATTASLDKMVTLNTAQFNKGEAGRADSMNAAKSGPLLATFPVKRSVGNLPVFGIGSRGVVSVGKEGKVHGFSRHWQTASDHDTVTETRSQAEVADLIRAQVADIAAKGTVEVQDVELGYYDGDGQYMQPVYRFRAKYTHASTGQAGKTDDDYIAGYIPIGTTLEAVPSLLDKAENPPGVPQGAPTNLPLSELVPSEPPPPSMIAQARPPVPPGDPTVGRYVVRNDYVGWQNSANGFWNGLQASGYGGYFTNSQYYWAYPYLFTSSKNSFCNGVHVCEIEVHGDWWLYTTYNNWGDIVTLDNIPYPGYGASAGGVQAYWVIHSCEVVPSAADTGSWADKWWHIFGGIHSVLGYRTIMYIDDGVMYPFGWHMGQGANLTSAWLQDCVASSMYWGSPGAVMHGSWKPYGRPSTVSVCGREGDSVYYTAGVGRAGCLQNYWYY